MSAEKKDSKKVGPQLKSSMRLNRVPSLYFFLQISGNLEDCLVKNDNAKRKSR